MKSKNEILNELHQISPKMAEIEKKEIFRLDDNYFADLKERILERKRKKVSNYFLQIPQILSNTKVKVVFTVILIAFISTYILFKVNHQTTSNDIEEYVISNINSDIIVDYLMNDLKSTETNNSAQEDLLIDNIDEFLIIEQL